jgi:hypothetical protein
MQLLTEIGARYARKYCYVLQQWKLISIGTDALLGQQWKQIDYDFRCN